METVFTPLAARLAAGEDAMLCVIVASEGSTPRGAGAMMAVFADGTFAGTIGGGAVEYAALQRAQQLLREQRSDSERFSLRTDGADTLGMICGGDVTVAFRLLHGEAALLPARAAEQLLAQRVDCWLVLSLDPAVPNGIGLYDASGGLRFLPEADEMELRPQLGRRPVLTAGAPQYFLLPLGSAARIYVFGGGHVSQALVPLLAWLDYHVVVLENRAEFAVPERFPGAERVTLTTFSRFAAETTVGPRDGIVIMTRGHQDDYEVLQQALRTDAGYVGVIGSRRKAALTLERLADDGFSEADRARVHTPIGLPIGAETPGEIAVSVAAELIRFRAGL